MNPILALIWLLSLAILLPVSSAFPLTGGNGETNITIFGVFQGGHYGGDNLVVVDCYYPGSISVIDPFMTLIDTEDKYHDPWDSMYDDSIWQGLETHRMQIVFRIPPEAVIKRLKISPGGGTPFFVEWTGVPEVKNENFSMKFYSATENGTGNSGGSTRSYTKRVMVELKVTNEALVNVALKNEGFYAVDQFGWEYPANGHHEEVLLSGESMRFKVTFEGISELSRLVTLGYRPEGLAMDISAWT